MRRSIRHFGRKTQAGRLRHNKAVKFPVSMLHDFVRTTLSAEELGDLLTMAGFELEGIETVDGEPVLDIKVMSNRGDGLSVFGLAREVLAKDAASEPTELYQRAANRFADLPTDGPANPATVAIETEDCPRYACRIFTGVSNDSAPDWIRERLTRAGMRSISLLVDLTNYVMLELGQPLHAFDYDKLAGGRIVVRKAAAGEMLTTLDGKEHALRPDQMMICDAERPVAVAGVMGGAATEVDAGTTRVLLESAAFLNTSVRRTRKQLGLSTEASYRFERSVDPEGVVAAVLRFSELLDASASAVVDEYPGRESREALALRPGRARLLLGMEVTDDDAETHLRRLGMDVRREGDRLMVVPPSWRPDIVREEDLIEEVGRVHGYDRIPETPLRGTNLLGGPQGALLLEDRLREAIVRLGYVQAVSHSLRDLHPLDKEGERVGPRNPGSPEAAFLRNSMLPGLAEAAARNGSRDLRLFELGQAFVPTEKRLLGMLLTPPDADFFALKGEVEAAAKAIGVQIEFAVPQKCDERLHPGRQAVLLAEGSEIGVFGELHPEIAAAAGLPTGTTVAELDVSAMIGAASPERAIKPVSRNPANPRDIALLIDRSVPYAEIERKIETSGGELLEKQSLVEVYTGAGIPEGKHSLTLRLTFRKMGGNLTDEEANQARDSVVAALAELGGSMR
jgi:phenylalanyl-tRNA synthetase beta chain